MQEKTRGTLEMSAAMAISGTIGWFVVSSGQSVLNVVFFRCLFGAATLLLVCLALGVFKRGVISFRQLIIAALGGVALVGNWLLLFAAYSHASISVATAVYNTQPFMLVALGALFMGERVTLTKLSWLCFAFLGVLLIAQSRADVGGSGSDYMTGIVLALAAAAGYAVAALVAKKLKGVPPHLIVLIQVTVGIPMLAPWASPAAVLGTSSVWAMLLTLGILHTGLMFVLLYSAIQKLPTPLIGALSFIYPVVAIVVDYVAFGRRLHWTQLLGAAVILVSAAATTLGWRLWPAALATPVRDKA